MVLLLAYAMVLWAITVFWRRRWQAFAALALGVPPIAGLTHLVVILNNHPDESPHTWIYYFGGVYAALVLGVGLFIAILPRSGPDEACPSCDYDVRGIRDICPECGLSLDAEVTSAERMRDRHWRSPDGSGPAPQPDDEAAADRRAELLRTVRRVGVES